MKKLKIQLFSIIDKSEHHGLMAKADQLISALFVIIIMMIMSSVLMFEIEKTAQPDVFRSVFDAMWWAVATLTTVGYGDIYPVTILGKILSAVIAMLGIGIVAIPTGIIASGFTELIQQKSLNQKKYCPYCGHALNDDVPDTVPAPDKKTGRA